ncbi:enoyl-CoA-hydratase DpgB [Streptomyces sp. NPDC014793]|uniref:enoyl-CoA-hydratase DpgB n=1 Tax=Streptomyces sp. NPDC014793 TaxID=3364914 RepID=UPI0036FD9CF7
MSARPGEPDLTDSCDLTLRVDHKAPLAELAASLHALCDRAEEDSQRGTGVVVIRLGTISPDDRSWPVDAETQQVNRWEKAVRRLERLTAVSVVVAESTCGGPALDLLLASDYRIVTPDVRLLLPVSGGRLWPGMGVHRLVNQVGAAAGRRLLMWGAEITAQRAQQMDLVDEITTVPSEAVRSAALLLGRAAGRDLAVLRQLILEAPTTAYEDALGVHLAACDREIRRRRGPDAADRHGPNGADQGAY